MKRAAQYSIPLCEHDMVHRAHLAWLQLRGFPRQQVLKVQRTLQAMLPAFRGAWQHLVHSEHTCVPACDQARVQASSLCSYFKCLKAAAHLNAVCII